MASAYPELVNDINQVTTMTFLRTPYNYDMNKASNESGIRCPEETLAQQQFADEADINTIVKRFNLTGQLPENVRMPTFGDFTGISDYQSALHALMQAEESFNAMPADIRTRFENNPQKFLEFCSDDKNAEEAKRLGLTKAPPSPVQALGATPSTPPTGPTPAPAPTAP